MGSQQGPVPILLKCKVAKLTPTRQAISTSKRSADGDGDAGWIAMAIVAVLTGRSDRNAPRYTYWINPFASRRQSYSVSSRQDRVAKERPALASVANADPLVRLRIGPLRSCGPDQLRRG
jgi:hypothetical protein